MRCALVGDFGNASNVISSATVREVESAVSAAQEYRSGAIQAELGRLGWVTEAPVAAGLAAKFDALKAGTAVEIEFTLRDYVFREWVYFQKAHLDGGILAAIHIVPMVGAGPNAGWVCEKFRACGPVFSVPLLVYGVSPD